MSFKALNYSYGGASKERIGELILFLIEAHFKACFSYSEAHSTVLKLIYDDIDTNILLEVRVLHYLLCN